MSAVIEFPAGRIRPVTAATNTGNADVIIFPGVRVERLAFDLAERLPAVRGGATPLAQVKDYDFY